MRAFRSLPVALLAFVLLAAPAAAAVGEGVLNGECPTDPSRCVYARASITVGPVTITVEASVENGSAEEEANVSAHAGDEGTFTFSLLANASSAGSTINATLTLNETPGITWTNGTTRDVSYVAQAGFPHRETFTFHVNDDAALGTVALPFSVTIGDATGSSGVGITIVEEESNEDPEDAVPFAPVALLLVGGALLALLTRRGQR